MKKIGTCLLTALMFCLLAMPALATSKTEQEELTYLNLNIYVDGAKVELKDANGEPAEPFIINGTTYLPVRAVSEALGYEITWDGDANTIAVMKTDEAAGSTADIGVAEPDEVVSKTELTELTYRDIKIYVDGTEINPTDVNGDSTEPFLINGTTYLPIRAMSEALGYAVDYTVDRDGKTNSITITSEGKLLANKAMEEVTAIGFMDLDGAKLKAIAVKYDRDMTGADVSRDTYGLSGYLYESAPAEKAGEITKVYINDKAETVENAVDGSGNGSYVIIEINTDYLNEAESSFIQALSAGVMQKKLVTVGETEIFPSPIEVKNYTRTVTMSAGGWGKPAGPVVNYTLEKDSFVIPDIASFRFYTDNTDTEYPVDGPGFIGHNCFDEKTGETFEDFHVAYAVSLPAGYSESGRYAMVVLDNPAAEEGTHPLMSVLETRSPAVYASEWAQKIVKEKHGLDGLVVVVPVVTARVDDNGCSPAQYDALVQLWDNLIETYHVDKDHVYGSGQSVGGMVLLETNRNRDNYFAGLMLYEDQWAQNYYKDGLFNRSQNSRPQAAANAPYHYPRTNGDLTWDYYLDTAGEPVYEGHDPNNYYFLVSDDNILIMNCSSNYLSNDSWTEFRYLYKDLAGYDFERLILDGEDDLSAQEETIQTYLARDNTLGLNWISFDHGSNGYTCRKVMSGYEWLLSQDRQDEITREKLDINKPFELADEQIQDESRKLHYVDVDNSAIYYKTGKSGAGTQFYNTVLLTINFADPNPVIADKVPGWLPDGMSWDKGVKGAKIVRVTAIGNEAAAIEYSEDMTGLVVNLKGDPIHELFTGEIREGETVRLDPFEFRDANGNKLDVIIKNVYVNDSAAVKAGAERESGSGRYVIVEFDGAAAQAPTGVIQRTTVRTDTVIASPSHKLYQ